jgi:hypothetical protein
MKFENTPARERTIRDFYIASGPRDQPNTIFHLVEASKRPKPNELVDSAPASINKSSHLVDSRSDMGELPGEKILKKPMKHLVIASWHYGDSIPKFY